MTIWSGTITSGSDDAQESGGTMDLSSSNLNANATTHLCGMRFTGVTIAAGSTVTAAALEIYLPSGSFDDPDVTFSGEAAGNAAAFSTNSNDLTDRTKTTATVSWAASNLGTGPQTTPDLSAIVAEIVGGAGWASGNALVLFVAGSSSSLLRWGAADGSNPAAELSVTYTPPGSGPAVAVLAAHYRRLAGAGAV